MIRVFLSVGLLALASSFVAVLPTASASCTSALVEQVCEEPSGPCTLVLLQGVTDALPPLGSSSHRYGLQECGVQVCSDLVWVGGVTVTVGGVPPCPS
jgi:hypothetical protein